MARYVDADRLLERAVPMGWSTPKWVSDIVIEDALTADVVSVVRCKECKQYEQYIKAHYKNGTEVESHECRRHKMAVAPDWFCADGKRRK